MRRLAAIAALLLACHQAPAAERHLVIVSGLGGEARFSDLFHRWSTTMFDAAVGRLGLSRENVVYLAEAPERDPERIAGPSRKADIEAAIGGLTERSRPGDLVAVLLIGHGTARDGRALFNLPGPDLRVEELAGWLERLDGRTVVVVNAASASGAFVQPLAGPGRVIIAATAGSSENQATSFGGHFVDAFTGAVADADKDGRVSMLEAFLHGQREVRRAYERERRLLTEHAVIEDDGDGVPTLEVDADEDVAGEGRLARSVHLAAWAPGQQVAEDDPVAQALEAEARELVERIEAHRRRRAGLSTEGYLEGLESLLVELALNRRAARERREP